MKRLVFIVEGDSELILLNKLIMPYLYLKGFQVTITGQTIVTNRKQNKKGGVTSYGKFKNEVTRTLAQGNVLVTTLIDFFKLPTDFPAYTTDSNKISQIEKAIHDDFQNNENFLPYIQKHELEALMFAELIGFELVVDEDYQLQEIKRIIEKYPNPEDINNLPETAPSKRLDKIFHYQKTNDSELIFEMMEMENILNKCPRFNNWINALIDLLSRNMI